MVECRSYKKFWWCEILKVFDHINVHHIVDAHKEVTCLPFKSQEQQQTTRDDIIKVMSLLVHIVFP